MAAPESSKWIADIGELIGLGHSIEAYIYTIALCSIRMYAAFNILPPTSAQTLQGITRTGLVVILGGFIAFGATEEHVRTLTSTEWILIVAKEMILGLLMGFAVSTVFWTAQSVGALIDTQAGYNSVQLTNPLSGEQATPVSDLLLQMVIATFYILGGMTVFVGAMFESFKVWPLLAPLPSMGALSDVVFLREVDTMMVAIIKFATPALIIMLLIDLGIGLITRTADKLEPHNLSQPIKGATIMLILALMAGIFVTQVRHALLPVNLIERMQKVLPHNKHESNNPGTH